MLTRPFYADFGAKQAFFAYLRTETFLAYQSFLCLPARTFPFMLVRPFYAYQTMSCSKSCLSVWKKNEINLSRNDGFFGDGLSGLKIYSRQKDR